jgi:3-dehydroquinate dehydratase-1
MADPLFRNSFPLVVGSLTSPHALELLQDRRADLVCHILELRLDCYPEQAAAILEEGQRTGLPLLITARHPAEGGQNLLSLAQREELLLQALPYAAAIDVEAASLPEMPAVLAACLAARVPVVASAHFFDKTPPLEHLIEIRAAVAKFPGVGCFKTASKLHGPEDVQTLLGIFSAENALPASKRLPLAIMGMGPLGKASRFLFAKLGSCLNYGYSDQASVPGQWAAYRLKELLEE